MLIAGDLIFSDTFLPPGDNGGATENEANAQLIMNFVAMHAMMVPEPSTLAMLALAGIALAPCSRRRR